MPAQYIMGTLTSLYLSRWKIFTLMRTGSKGVSHFPLGEFEEGLFDTKVLVDEGKALLGQAQLPVVGEAVSEMLPQRPYASVLCTHLVNSALEYLTWLCG